MCQASIRKLLSDKSPEEIRETVESELSLRDLVVTADATYVRLYF